MGIVFFSGIFVSICESFDALKPIARFMPNYYITRLNDELYNTLFLVQGAAVCVAIITATAIIGCLLFKRQDIK
jgi:ABC-type multidrug transport system permease subunit